MKTPTPASLPLPEGRRCIDLFATATAFGFRAERLPRPLRILFENVIAYGEAGEHQVAAFGEWLEHGQSAIEIPFRPGRILTHDTAGIAALVDLAALRDAVAARGGDPASVTLAVPTDLVVDHSVAVDFNGRPDAAAANAREEIERNRERYRFLRWAEKAFDRLRIVPPGNGICHQVNMEYLTTVAAAAPGRPDLVIADTVIGTDSHTTMVTALGVLGWGVGGIEAEAVALGEPLVLALPEVTGCRFFGRRQPGVTAADIALSVARKLRDYGVVGRFVEFFGEGLTDLSLSDRAAIANMAPEYGAMCGLFPVDEETLRYLAQTGRSDEAIALVEAYARATGLWRDDSSLPVFSDILTIDIGEVQPVVAGPRRPQEITPLSEVPARFREAFPKSDDAPASPVAGTLKDGDIVMAAITSCTHTANPSLMIAAGLIARNARRAGLTLPARVKASLSPGSRSVADYLERSGLQDDLDALGFAIAGFGCMTCAGNSGPLSPEIDAEIRERDLVVCGVLSGNRNFEGRIHPQLRACYLASPALVIAFALAGSIKVDLTCDPIGRNDEGEAVFLRDIWPDETEVAAMVAEFVRPEAFNRLAWEGYVEPPEWRDIDAPDGPLYPWPKNSTHISRPPFFDADAPRSRLADIAGARPLLVLGNAITTDHISPFGRILPGSPAAQYLGGQGLGEEAWSSYAERRGNHEVLQRGTFANPRIRNALLPGQAGNTTIGPDGEIASVFDAAIAFKDAGQATVVFAGKEYGTGSARDWAAKGTALLGVKVVVAESFERIHRINLVGLGVLPCELPAGTSVEDLGITPETEISFEGLAGINGPRSTIRMRLSKAGERTRTVSVTCRLDTEAELGAFREGGLFSLAEQVVGIREHAAPRGAAVSPAALSSSRP